jgi:hypothetical protein
VVGTILILIGMVGCMSGGSGEQWGAWSSGIGFIIFIAGRFSN